MLFRLLEVALLVVALVAVGIIICGYMKPVAERRKAKKREDLDRELSDYLKNERKE